MGFVHSNFVSVHTKNNRVMLKYEFTNKNGDLDYMYVELPKGYELRKIETNNEKREILNLTSENKELNEIWRNKDY